MMVLLPSFQRVVVILATLLITGCAGIKMPPTIIFQGDPYLVRLDLDRSIGGPDDPRRYTHPIDIETGQIHTIFDSIRVEEHRSFFQHAFKGPAKQMRVFSKHDITLFAPHIHKAFLQATPQERVIFAMINPVGNRYEVTAGEMFVKENTLHLTLNCFQSIDADNSPSSLCGRTYVSPHPSAIRPQTYDLSFTRKEHFVGFGKHFFGQERKEIIIDYTSIQSSATPLATNMASEGPSSIGQLLPMNTTLQKSKPIHPPTVETPPSRPEQMVSSKIQQQPLEQEDSSDDATDRITAVEDDHIQRLERKIKAQTQAIHTKYEARKQRTSLQQNRILFLKTPLMRGEDVAALQRALGFPADRIDGIFGKETDRAVRTFQKQKGMVVDGKVGLNTVNALR
jgi:hypothetical protein